MSLRSLASPRPDSVDRRMPRRLLIAMMALFVMVGSLALVRPAAAAEDAIDSLRLDYEVQPSGDLLVKQTMVYHFGSVGDRHGIKHVLVTREPWDETQDAVYKITEVTVESPDAPDSFEKSEDRTGRERFLEIKVGDANKTVPGETATYVITYKVQGAMRSFPDYDEFYWDAVGDLNPAVKDIVITAKVPGGVQKTSCFTGPAKSTTPCTSAQVGPDGVATYTQDALRAGHMVTVGAMIGSGLVTDNKPHLVPADRGVEGVFDTIRSTIQGIPQPYALGGWFVSLLGSPLLIWNALKRSRDRRYAGLIPGELPRQGDAPEVELQWGKPTIPVRYEPPQMPVSWVGMIENQYFTSDDTAAALVSLATRNVIGLRQTKTRGGLFGLGTRKEMYARPANLNQPLGNHDRAVLQGIWGISAPNHERLVTEVNLRTMHDELESAVTTEMSTNKLIERWPRSGASIGGLFWLVLIAAGAIVLVPTTKTALLVLWVIPLLIAVRIARGLRTRGVLSADGRVLADQVAGFREYIGTAEADQIRFEEGEDIFSKYLPWAVAFDLADRWADICQQLVAAGKLSARPPSWYYGSEPWDYSEATSMSDYASTNASPVSYSSSGTGSGGGSSFSSDSGGSSGGGGGGGGTSSW